MKQDAQFLQKSFKDEISAFGALVSEQIRLFKEELHRQVLNNAANFAESNKQGEANPKYEQLKKFLTESEETKTAEGQTQKSNKKKTKKDET